MSPLLEKRELLQSAGYRYNFDREVYVNREARKVFSLEFVEDNQEEVLRKMIREENGDGWHFYFNAQPSPAIRQTLQRELEALPA